ncbi:MAG: phosphoribosyltransferase family protein [Bacteroidetes bacterium]|nr:phosphoribosyltransferase family protein [Bacteroidota bacterium]MDA1333714.1 phosphoribosyltransferase family protein [Bacteroidota bacterium]
MRYQLARAAFDLFIPPVCFHCTRGQAVDIGLCRQCKDLLTECEIPKRELPGQTLSGRNVYAVWYYRNGSPLRSLHRLAKYAENERVAYWLGKQLGRKMSRHREAMLQMPGPLHDMVTDRTEWVCVPVPSHPARIMERGLDSTRWMGKAVAEELKMRFAPELLKRIRLDTSQSQVDGSDRAGNVIGAFSCDDRAVCHVLLIDDIVTTGATMEAAASVLENRGHRVKLAVIGFRREMFAYTRYQ